MMDLQKKVMMAVNSAYLFLKFEKDWIVGPVFFVLSTAIAYIVWQYSGLR